MTTPRGLRARFKQLFGPWWARLGFDFIEYCHDCGVRQPLVWWAADELWDAVMGDDGRNGGGVVCPRCFNKRAERAGGGLLMWHPEHDPAAARAWLDEHPEVR